MDPPWALQVEALVVGDMLIHIKSADKEGMGLQLGGPTLPVEDMPGGQDVLSNTIDEAVEEEIPCKWSSLFSVVARYL